MRVLLLNIDSKLPNIALKKIEMWHKQRGDEIIWDIPMMLGATDKVYASCIFAKNANVVANYRGLYPELIAGGTGCDLTIKLPPEIENMKPKINYGFTTRGCIRNCSFCLVPKAEGKIRIVGDIYDIWDGSSNKLTLMDNNILALPDHFHGICQQLIREKLRVDFNQGLDIRLITDDIAKELSGLRNHRLRFAFDSPKIEKGFRKGIEIVLGYVHANRLMIYLLVGFDTTFKEDIYRLKIIRGYGCDVFVMLYNNLDNRLLREFARWNNRFQLRHITFRDYLRIRRLSYLLDNEVERDIGI